MAVLENLEPKNVFRFFEDLCAIPHGSGNTKAISDYLVNFAKERGLEYHQDELNNVIIAAEAAPGYENAPAVIIQGHMDMVCEKAPGCSKDMSREGLDLAVEGDHVYAKGTTLGGDDGIAVAMALAVLDDRSIPRPRVEAVITVDEETGMEGARGLDLSPLKGNMVLNIDSEDEGIFTVSCAGGATVECHMPVVREAFEGGSLNIVVDGLIGGHSGAEIDKMRANSNMLMGRLLYALKKSEDFRLVSVDGGLKDNAIPTKSAAVITAKNAEGVKAVCAGMEKIFRDEFRVTDGNIKVTVSPADEAPAMDSASTAAVISMLCCLPNGIQAMSADIKGLVQTSLNLGILTSAGTEVCASFSVRSSVDSQKRMLMDRLSCFMEQLGGSVAVRGDYPGWAYRQNSPLRDLMAEVFTEQYGHAPRIEAIHAGLECGLFIGKRPELDCVSFGPDIKEIHTFREKLCIASTQRTWKLLLEVLRRIK
ncbi:MAG: aminoacyl-histidine dipeptidase [Candidatus Limivicinus sp.]|jgi:dipeptidase D